MFSFPISDVPFDIHIHECNNQLGGLVSKILETSHKILRKLIDTQKIQHYQEVTT